MQPKPLNILMSYGHTNTTWHISSQAMLLPSASNSVSLYPTRTAVPARMQAGHASYRILSAACSLQMDLTSTALSGLSRAILTC